LWTAASHERTAKEMQALNNHNLQAVGRLKPGVSITEAVNELSLITLRIHNAHADDPFISSDAHGRFLLESLVGDVRTPLLILLCATGCVLLIACLNIANLLVARSVGRRRELAIRTALGGSRAEFLGHHLAESLLLSIAGGALGLLLAYLPGWSPHFQVETTRCSLRSRSRRDTYSGGHARARLRRVLLTVEVGLTVVLLIGAGLLLKSYARLRSSDLGCVTRNVLTMQVSLPAVRYDFPRRCILIKNSSRAWASIRAFRQQGW
jgi:hypothetical protein